jgi:thiopeptide-type bacteriocin biosynthesis protein
VTSRFDRRRARLEPPRQDEAPPTQAVSRKKILLELLAEQEAQRCGLSPSDEEIDRYGRAFRRRFDLESDDRFQGWCESAGLGASELRSVYRRHLLVEAMERRYARDIDERLPTGRAVWTATRYRPTDPTWTQVNVGLAHEGPRPIDAAVSTLSALFGAAGPDDRGGIRSWFFVRKPPGMRIRIAWKDAPEPDLLVPRLAALRDGGLVAGWVFTCYEPEVHLFGGPEGIELAHAFAAVDSRLWLEAQLTLGTRIDEGTLLFMSAAVLNDLFTRALGNGEEIWDVWKGIAAGLEAIAPGAGREWPPLDGRAHGQGLERLVCAYQRCNGRMAERLRQLSGSGALRIGPRAFLAVLATFHWNRFGLTPAQRLTISADMCRRLDPFERRP